jgi:hypothetical protein
MFLCAQTTWEKFSLCNPQGILFVRIGLPITLHLFFSIDTYLEEKKRKKLLTSHTCNAILGKSFGSFNAHFWFSCKQFEEIRTYLFLELSSLNLPANCRLVFAAIATTTSAFFLALFKKRHQTFFLLVSPKNFSFIARSINKFVKLVQKNKSSTLHEKAQAGLKLRRVVARPSSVVRWLKFSTERNERFLGHLCANGEERMLKYLCLYNENILPRDNHHFERPFFSPFW